MADTDTATAWSPARVDRVFRHAANSGKPADFGAQPAPTKAEVQAAAEALAARVALMKEYAK
jgi:hypothetical protein